MISSDRAARSAAKTRIGIVHHALSRGDACTSTVMPISATADVEREARDADGRRQCEAAEGVASRAGQVEADAAERVDARLPQQVEHERHGEQIEEHAEELVGEVEPLPGRLRRIERGRLVAESGLGCHPSDDRHDRVHRAGSQREPQNDRDLDPETATDAARHCTPITISGL